MPDCPICLGDGELDFRDSDAVLGEQIPAADLARLVASGRLVWPIGVLPCDECDATGVVSEERLRELRAASVAAVDQAIAEYERRRKSQGSVPPA